MRLIVITLLLASLSGNAQTDVSALFVGNSYIATNNLPEMVSNLATSNNKTFTYQSITPGGASWGNHKDNLSTMEAIDTEQYDYLVLQEQSHRMAMNEYGNAKHSSRSFNNADILNNQSKKANTCRKTMFYLTWGRENGNPIYEPGGNFGLNFQNMQDYLTQNFMQLGELLDAEIAPVGEAWRKAMADYPEIDLFAGDGSHPSTSGTYLAACVFYTAFFHESISFNWHPNNITNTTAQQLQAVANEIVVGSYDTWNIAVENPVCAPSPLENDINEWNLTDLGDFDITDVHFIDNQNGYVKGTGTNVWKTNNAGESWTPITFPEVSPIDPDIESFFDVFFVNQNTIWYVINADDIDPDTIVDSFEGPIGDYVSYLKIFVSTDGGTTWSDRSPEREDYEKSASGSLIGRSRFWNFSLLFDDNNLNGTLLCNYDYSSSFQTVYGFTTNDGGITWQNYEDVITNTEFVTGQTVLTNTNEAYISGLKLGDPNETSLKIFQTTNAGISWEEIADIQNSCCLSIGGGMRQYFSVIRKIDTNNLLAATSLFSPTLYKSTDNGATWNEAAVIDYVGRVTDVIQPAEGIYYMFLNNLDDLSRVLVSYNYGETWELDTFTKSFFNKATATDNFVYAVGTQGTIYRRPISSILSNSNNNISLRESNITMYPNPSNGLLNINNLLENSTITLYNIAGAKMGSYTNAKNKDISLQLQHFSSGLYLVKIDNQKGSTTKKLIIE